MKKLEIAADDWDTVRGLFNVLSKLKLWDSKECDDWYIEIVYRKKYKLTRFKVNIENNEQ